jgi:multidrug efflux pump subunit AcrB
MNREQESIGFAGRLAARFVHSKLTPVLAVFSVLIGLVAVGLTPKEEEPQISVPMIDISIAAPGLEAEEVERMVAEPIERGVWGLEGVEYVYSSSQAHGALVTVRFKVGEPMEPSLVKVHHELMTIRSSLPAGVMDPQVKSFSIDDVPFLTLTFSSNDLSPEALRTAVAPLAREFSSTPDLASVELRGGLKRAIRVIADPVKLQSRGVSLLSLAQALEKNQIALPAGKNWGKVKVFDVDVGGRLSSKKDVEAVAVGQRAGRVVRVSDVAEVVDGPEEKVRESILLDKESGGAPVPAVSIVFSKRKGTNVVDLSKRLLERAKRFSGELPPSVRMTEIRNYGKTANQKSIELIEHLLIATLSVAALIALAMGLRASLVVAIAIPVTLALTLGVYYFLGYTLNRITLFALIFSIGILVDDAIVVVENIERHLKENPAAGLLRATIGAVSEVGNPTILATFTVIAAILPMAFVRGMMGPYMKPIPVGASLAMLLSLLVAFVVTPWASVRILRHRSHGKDDPSASPAEEGRLDRLYRTTMNRLLSKSSSALKFGALVLVLFAVSFSLLYFKAAKVKMLPFDNKNEFQVLIDYPASTPLQTSSDRSVDLAKELLKNPEVKKVQVFVGEAAPFSFSGMVKHSFLRGRDDQADLHVVLSDKEARKESSHQIIEGLRPLIRKFGEQHQAVTKVLEIPPGPPVLATMIAEIYGPTREEREKTAREVESVFRSEPSVVDLDSTLRSGRPRIRFGFDYQRSGALGASSRDFSGLGRLLFSETQMGVLDETSHPEEIGIDLSVQDSWRTRQEPFRGALLPSFESGSIDAGGLVAGAKVLESPVLYRKNLKPVSYVMSELSGSEEAPVYGMLKLQPKILVPSQTSEVPWDTTAPVLKWDGEWFITYEVFRDLGGAFAVVILLIYVLVLGWFRSYTVPLVIMAPIPISLIGILPGHALLGAYFTATSMIGFIAGAGIIVRNSIILVDFIELQLSSGVALRDAVIDAGVLRFRPMLLTAAAVVVGGAVMLADPIFQGLAISLMFGEVAATLLSRFAVPVLYYWFLGKARVRTLQGNRSQQPQKENSYDH